MLRRPTFYKTAVCTVTRGQCRVQCQTVSEEPPFAHRRCTFNRPGSWIHTFDNHTRFLAVIPYTRYRHADSSSHRVFRRSQLVYCDRCRKSIFLFAAMYPNPWIRKHSTLRQVIDKLLSINSNNTKKFDAMLNKKKNDGTAAAAAGPVNSKSRKR